MTNACLYTAGLRSSRTCVLGNIPHKNKRFCISKDQLFIAEKAREFKLDFLSLKKKKRYRKPPPRVHNY